MSATTGYHNRGTVVGAKIYSLLYSLNPSTHDEISPKIGYWIEYVLTEPLMSADDLVEEVSPMAWGGLSSSAGVATFLKEFRDAPHRSEQARTYVDKLCSRVLRWFSAASAETLPIHQPSQYSCVYPKVASGGEGGFLQAASFVGHIIECGLLSREIVRRQLVKSLTAHYYPHRNSPGENTRANAIYLLLIAAGNTLLQGLLDPEDVQASFGALDAQASLGGVAWLDARKLQVRRTTHSDASHWNLTCPVRNFTRSVLHG